MVHAVAVDLDADGQVDLLTLTREGGRCHSVSVHWMKPHSGGPAIGESCCTSPRSVDLLPSYHSDYQEMIGNGVLSPPLVLE